VLNHAGLWEADVALAGQFPQRVPDGGPGPIGTIAVDSELGGEFVGGLEADAPDVVGQLVRVPSRRCRWVNPHAGIPDSSCSGRNVGGS